MCRIFMTSAPQSRFVLLHRSCRTRIQVAKDFAVLKGLAQNLNQSSIRQAQIYVETIRETESDHSALVDKLRKSEDG